MEISDYIYKLIQKASCELPEDIHKALIRAKENENEERPKKILDIILKNISFSEERQQPMCQDTGYPLFYAYVPDFTNQNTINEIILKAMQKATENQILRPNAVDSLTGENTGNNLGKSFPYIHYKQWTRKDIRIDLLLKGGGCENVGKQYSLPDFELNAGRDIDGIYKCIIDSVCKAQGLGCAPGILGIGIGGDRGTSFIESKKQLFRKLDDINENETLVELEKSLFFDINKLGIGPMGLGGKTTVLGVKIGSIHRVPASFFVTISYLCWAGRRKSLLVKENGDWKID